MLLRHFIYRLMRFLIFLPLLSILHDNGWTDQTSALGQRSLAHYSLLPTSLPYFGPPAQELGDAFDDALETGRILNRTECVMPLLSFLHVSSWTKHAPALGQRSLDHYPLMPESHPYLGHPVQELDDTVNNTLETGSALYHTLCVAERMMKFLLHINRHVQAILINVAGSLSRCRCFVHDYLYKKGRAWSSTDSVAWNSVLPHACDGGTSASVKEKCQVIKSKFLQRLMSKHDFQVLFPRGVAGTLKPSPWRVLCHKLHLLVEPRVKSLPSAAVVELSASLPVGGGRIPTFTLKELKPYLADGVKGDYPCDSVFRYVGHYHFKAAEANYQGDEEYIYAAVPMQVLLPKLTAKDRQNVAKSHHIHLPHRCKATEVSKLIGRHSCAACASHVSVFSLHVAQTSTQRTQKYYNAEGARAARAQQDKDRHQQPANKQAHADGEQKRRDRLKEFPPSPPSRELQSKIITGWCEGMAPETFQECGCAVCGQLVPTCDTLTLAESTADYSILKNEGKDYTRMERNTSKDPIQEISGPILDTSCSRICLSCDGALSAGEMPKYALARGLWLGGVPEELKNLSYAEQFMICRVRRSKSIVTVSSSGMKKMNANAVMFENPTPKIYQMLPPSREELDEVLAFIYTGPCRPSPEDFERTPLLVRKEKVAKALEWLKLNHCDYFDLDIDYNNLEKYPEDQPPVEVVYRQTDTNKNPESASAYDNDTEEGVDDGTCAFVVNGVTGEELDSLPLKALKAKAAMHLKEEGAGVLAVGHGEGLVSIYDNPQLYPMMFPWLFPYGLGGIGGLHDEELSMSDTMHKRRLLMYHDKRFQLDPHFALIAFNHEQIKQGTTGGYLLTDKSNFKDAVDRLMKLDTAVLEDVARRLSDGQRVKPESDEEKVCYELLHDLDHVGGHVPGSLTSKKYMRSEIWSLISHLGAPSWFITFAPADVRHPICLYYADTKETFSPEMPDDDRCRRLIANNPVAGARFFHFVVELFIKHVLGVDQDHSGLYGDTAGYYGTVEQQGRLTLHLHLLLWIKGSPTPQEIRDKIVDPDSDFQKKMVEYLESLCVGQFLEGTKPEVVDRVREAEARDGYQKPVHVLPEAPPPACDKLCDRCECESKRQSWWQRYRSVVDDILLRCNQHDHDVKTGQSYCMNAKGQCKRRFPRETFEETMVDPSTGALNLKKGEANMNTVTPELSYLLRSNSDVTSLLSGTAIKAIVAYVTDYITKQSLKTYTVFNVIKSIYDKNTEVLGSDIDQGEKARKIFTQVTNALSAKMEIGGPMACMYLLGNPDHYTSHKFVPFYWKSFVKEARSVWANEDDGDIPDLEMTKNKVVIDKQQDRLVGISKVQDYVYRPAQYSDVCLYDWIRLYEKVKRKKPIKGCSKSQNAAWDSDTSDDELNIGRDTADFLGPTGGGLTDKNGDGECIEDSYHSEQGSGDSDLEVQIEMAQDTDDDSGNGSDVGGDEEETVVEDDEEDELDVMNVAEPKVTGKDSRAFLPDHDQYRTHQARMKKDNPFVVANFSPEVLPRSDRGDREYYCSTMLAVFKPWRTGKDLKAMGESWDDAYTSHLFSPRQTEIMKFQALRYECLDSRDDYSLQREKQEEEDSIPMQWASPDMLKMLDDAHDADKYSGADFQVDHSGEDVLLEGKGRQRLNENMMSAERIMRRAGWLDPCVDHLPDVGSLDPVTPEKHLSNQAWRAAVLAKKKAVLEEKAKNMPANPKGDKSFVNLEPDMVKVVDKAYIDKMFQPSTKEDRLGIDNIAMDYSLNEEQERAFRIIANHATTPGEEKLQMYLGGMGGTGKSQVIKAVVAFFNARNENHRFLVVAPTGAAAALLNGSTYHSVLGINDGKYQSGNTILQITARLEGVDYIFLDEVSMLSCGDLYKISAQCAKARACRSKKNSEGDNNTTEPFGGINFIFAGDFAQLPPVRSGSPLYNSVDPQVNVSATLRDQQQSVGKALWHQITTAVILRKNMRQDTISDEDNALRTALENMRYSACTPEDIKFLRTLKAGRGPNDPKLAQATFRNVSVITARNAQKDRINQLGCRRFAEENNQPLVSFHSIDEFHTTVEQRKKQKGRPRKHLIDPIRKNNKVPLKLQELLWKQPHSTSNIHIPARLDLCIGMPVMLRHNSATECCMTKGAEGTVAGWKASKGPAGKVVLDVLFVKLANPPKAIKFEGLPENVVPLTRNSITTECSLPNDDVVSLTREQVLVLPNFAMTDYASQGRTRPYNVVDLNSCKRHQSYYTCLSRSSSAAGTIIVQGFDPKVITGGCSGRLRQEFRELELLDEITRLRYENQLPEKVTGNTRNTLIRSYRKWKGECYVPNNVHKSIRWTVRDPLRQDPDVPASPWQILKSKGKEDEPTATTKSNYGFISAKGTVPVKTNDKPMAKFTSARRKGVNADEGKRVQPANSNVAKRKQEEDMQGSPARKRVKLDKEPQTLEGARGLIWDEENWSCAYDASFTILYALWSEDDSKWKRRFKDMNRTMSTLSDGFVRAKAGLSSLESGRNKVRNMLYARSPEKFPRGRMGASVSELAAEILKSDATIAYYRLRCLRCSRETQAKTDLMTGVIHCDRAPSRSTAEFMRSLLRCPSDRLCSGCHGSTEMITHFQEAPPILSLSLPSEDNVISISKQITVKCEHEDVLYVLKGIVYYANAHFTSQIVTANGDVWYHDGIGTGGEILYDGKLAEMSELDLLHRKGGNATLSVYSRQ